MIRQAIYEDVYGVPRWKTEERVRLSHAADYRASQISIGGLSGWSLVAAAGVVGYLLLAYGIFG